MSEPGVPEQPAPGELAAPNHPTAPSMMPFTMPYHGFPAIKERPIP